MYLILIEEKQIKIRPVPELGLDKCLSLNNLDKSKIVRSN